MTEFPLPAYGGLGLVTVGGTDAQRSGGQAIFIYRYFGEIVTKFIIDTSFAS